MIKLAIPRRHKYGAKKTTVDGIVFASGLEARRYQQLKLLLASGTITNLDLQPVFELQPDFRDNTGKKQQAINYKADFKYIEAGRVVIEEVKGFETPVWKLHKKMFLYQYPQLELRVLTEEDI